MSGCGGLRRWIRAISAGVWAGGRGPRGAGERAARGPVFRQGIVGGLPQRGDATRSRSASVPASDGMPEGTPGTEISSE
ncbi:hypothetical protein GCM10009716_13490 [Streptomyces sodiiphilus]|uniref:Uncharacterized protein n=1 Tax=Streptomyces sodiiphilus TaxID=226217 RepID=A0ABN2NWY4_9ACTN